MYTPVGSDWPQVLSLFQDLLQKLSEDDRGKLQRSMGLKLEQLKVQSPVCLP